MTKTHRLPRGAWVLLLAGVVGLVDLSWGGNAASAAKRAKPRKDGTTAPAEDTPAPPRGGAPAGVQLNACGCYRRGESCVCTNKNAKCACPEDCEPVGCEAKRQKEIDLEMAVEVKRAQDEDKKRQDADKAAEARAREQEARERQEMEGANEAESAEDSAGEPDTEVAAAPKAEEKAKAKENAPAEPRAKAREKPPGVQKAKAEEKAPARPVKEPRKGLTKK